MITTRRVAAYILCFLIGAVLLVLGENGMIDSYWSGMGLGLVIVCILRMVQYIRYHKDEMYREKIMVERQDERNQFIRNKAWAWAGSLFIMVSAVLMIVFKVMGNETMTKAASYAVCLLISLYWVSFFILRKKY